MLGDLFKVEGEITELVLKECVTKMFFDLDKDHEKLSTIIDKLKSDIESIEIDSRSKY